MSSSLWSSLDRLEKLDMQGGRDPFFNPFGSFGSFGGQRSLLSSFFGGRDPFDDPFFTRPFGHDPFFTRPFGTMFELGSFGPSVTPFMDPQTSGFLEDRPSQSNRSRGPIIEELTSDDEKEEKEASREQKDNPRKHGRSSKDPVVEDPDDAAEERKGKQLQFRNNFNLVNNLHSQPQAHSFTFQSSTVNHGGVNGACYTSSTTRRTGSDGMTFEESKYANSATGQAAHRVSRGIHDKGHSVTRKLGSEGRVDTMQTLHNLNEDELAGFEEAWKGNAKTHLPCWSEGLNVHGAIGSGSNPPNGSGRGGWALPSVEKSHQTGSTVSGLRDATSRHHPYPQHATMTRNNVDNDVGSSSRVRSRARGMGNVDQVRQR